MLRPHKTYFNVFEKCIKTNNNKKIIFMNIMQKRADCSTVPPVSSQVSSHFTLKQMTRIAQFNPFQKVTISLHYQKEKTRETAQTDISSRLRWKKGDLNLTFKRALPHQGKPEQCSSPAEMPCAAPSTELLEFIFTETFSYLLKVTELKTSLSELLVELPKASIRKMNSHF